MSNYSSDPRILAALEALLFSATEPIALSDLSQALGENQSVISHALGELEEKHNHCPSSGLRIYERAGGWRMYTAREYDDILSEYFSTSVSPKLSMAALETLAVIAYRQPVSRAQIAAIRGVSVDSVIRTLLSRDLISVVSTAEDNIAQMYGTTPYFLEVMGINSLDELAPLAPFLPDSSELDDVEKELP